MSRGFGIPSRAAWEGGKPMHSWEKKYSAVGLGMLWLTWGLLSGLDVAGSDFSHGQALNCPGKEVSIPKSCFREAALTQEKSHSLNNDGRKKLPLPQKLDLSGHKPTEEHL